MWEHHKNKLLNDDMCNLVRDLGYKKLVLCLKILPVYILIQLLVGGEGFDKTGQLLAK